MSPARTRSVFVLALSVALGVARPAVAQTIEHARIGRERLLAGMQRSGIPHYERVLPNGARRVYSNVGGGWKLLRRMERILPTGSNVLEILHIAKNANHTLALFDREPVHTQYVGNHWRLRWWSDRLRPSDGALYSAQIQLSDGEATRLRQMLNAALQEQGPEEQAGAQWENGHIRAALGGARCLNCVSTWSEMPLGDNGEPLWRLLGLRASYSGNPHALQQALETEANERVIGITLYGPVVEGFGTAPDQNVTRF